MTQINKTKPCNICGEIKTLDYFYTSKNKDGHKNYCKMCDLAQGKIYRQENKIRIRKHQKEYHSNNKDIRRAYRLFYKYGISIEDYNEMFNQQDGCCAICGVNQTELNKSLAVDHDHSTGEIRGLLCYKCNVSLGLMDEDTYNLSRMIKYIEQHS